MQDNYNVKIWYTFSVEEETSGRKNKTDIVCFECDAG